MHQYYNLILTDLLEEIKTIFTSLLPSLSLSNTELALPTQETVLLHLRKGETVLEEIQVLIAEMQCLEEHEVYSPQSPSPYTHTRELGRGGFAIVDAVKITTGLGEGMVVARKRFRVPRFRPTATLTEFKEEVRIIRKLRHHHIIDAPSTYLEISDSGLPLYFGIIITPVADMNLAEFLEEQQHKYQEADNELQEEILNRCRERFGKWHRCLANGLSYFHAQRVRHKDIKPTNILIKGNDVLYADFGLSKYFEESETTMTNGHPGPKSPMYCAPEVAAGEERRRSADVWSLGCVFLEMVTVMSGKSLAEFQTRRGAPGQRAYHLRPELTLQWIIELGTSVERVSNAEQLHFSRSMIYWCSLMLHPSPKLRITSGLLAEQIYQNTEPSNSQYCFCKPEPPALASQADSQHAMGIWPHVQGCNSPTWEAVTHIVGRIIGQSTFFVSRLSKDKGSCRYRIPRNEDKSLLYADTLQPHVSRPPQVLAPVALPPSKNFSAQYRGWTLRKAASVDAPAGKRPSWQRASVFSMSMSTEELISLVSKHEKKNAKTETTVQDIFESLPSPNQRLQINRLIEDQMAQEEDPFITWNLVYLERETRDIDLLRRETTVIRVILKSQLNPLRQLKDDFIPALSTSHQTAQVRRKLEPLSPQPRNQNIPTRPKSLRPSLKITESYSSTSSLSSGTTEEASGLARQNIWIGPRFIKNRRSKRGLRQSGEKHLLPLRPGTPSEEYDHGREVSDGY